MRVLAMTNLYPNPYQPERATFNRRQLKTLADAHAVRVVAPIAWVDELRARRAGSPALPSTRRLVHDGLQVEHPRYWYTPKVGRRWYGRWFEASVAGAFRRACEEFAPDVVFAPWAYPDGWAAVRLARRVDLPVVVKCHGSDVLLVEKHPSRRGPTVAGLCAADGVVAVSEHIATKLKEMGVRPERLRVVVDGVDRNIFSPGSQAEARARLGIMDEVPQILFVGNLAPVKGVDVLLRACAALRDAGVRFRLTIVGNGPLRGALQAQVKALGLNGMVEFLGTKPHAELPDRFRAADLFVLPSRSEGIPNVLLEASACGTPWVASTVGGIPEIAELGRSKLVRPEDSGALANVIRDMLTSPPPAPSQSPRSHLEAVADLADFLEQTRGSHAAKDCVPV